MHAALCMNVLWHNCRMWHGLSSLTADAPTQTAIPFLIGTKFDTFSTFPRDEQEEITKQVRSQ